MVAKIKECPYCKAGNTPNEKGDHWIVKSIMPAKINIRKCTTFPINANTGTSDLDIGG